MEAIRIGADLPGAVPTSASDNFITGIDRAETVGIIYHIKPVGFICFSLV